MVFKENAALFENKSPEAFYILGVFMSDGNNHQEKAKASYRLTLHSIDRNWLIQIRDLIFQDSKIHKKKKQRIWYISKRSMKIGTWMYSYGCVPNKSKILQWPKDIPEENYKDLVRGLIDGDGTICINNSKGTLWGSVSLCSGSKKFIEDFIEKMDSFGFKFTISKRWKKPSAYSKKGGIVYYARITNAETKHFLKWLYYDDGLICLNRKYNKANAIVTLYINVKSKSEWNLLKSKVINLREEGQSIKYIASQLHISVAVVKKYVKGIKAGYFIKKHENLRNLDMNQAKTYYAQDYSIAEISDKMQKSLSCIYSYLKGHLKKDDGSKIKLVKDLRKAGDSMGIIHEKTGLNIGFIKSHIKGTDFVNGKRASITPQIRNKIFEDISLNFSNQEISSRNNISLSTVKNYKKMYNSKGKTMI